MSAPVQPFTLYGFMARLAFEIPVGLARCNPVAGAQPCLLMSRKKFQLTPQQRIKLLRT